MSDFYKAGYKKKDLIQVKQRIIAANRQPIEIKGAIFLSVEADSYSTHLMATPDIKGFYLSRQVLCFMCNSGHISSNSNNDEVMAKSVFS